MSRQTVAEIGEFGLIGALAARLPASGDAVVAGIGDDVAVVAITAERWLALTCDVQVAGIHFLPERCDPVKLGRKAAAINLSDIAAVGGRPLYALVSLGLPPDTEVAFLEAVYDGLGAEAARWGAGVVGGNVSRAADLFLDLTLVGEVEPGRLLRRSGARPGDLVCVTGDLGAAAAGLELQRAPHLHLAAADRARALAAFETPTPRLAEAAAIVAAGGATAMLDVSDGLAADLGHLCDASAVGVRVEAARLPIDASTARVAAAAGVSPLAWALAGGEDYELVFSAAAERAAALAEAVERRTGTAVTIIGEVLDAARGRTVVLAGGEAPLAGGWTHF